MKRKLISLALTCACACSLLLAPAHAAGAEESFPTVNTYPGYADVTEGDWFYDTAKLCYEIGLITGTEKGFEPHKVLTGAECAAIAARVREALTGKAIPMATPLPGETLPWYTSYANYLMDAAQESGSSYYGIINWDELEKPATRVEFLAFTALMVDGYYDLLPPINDITALPDVKDDNVVLFFYNAGILTGVDKYGTFDWEKTLTRAEAAAMVARIARPELRQSFVPADYTPFTAAGVTPNTVFFTNGVTAEAYLAQVNSLIGELEHVCALNYMEFNWFNTYGEDTFLDYVKETALSNLGVTEKEGTAEFRAFDVQVYYSKYFELAGAMAAT